MSPTLLVVLGAGASIRAGVPSTADLTASVDEAIPGKTSAGWAWAISNGPPPGQILSDAFGVALRAAVRAHFGNHAFGQGYQFENLLGAVEELEEYAYRQTFLSKLVGLPGGQTTLDDALMLSATRSAIVEVIHREVGQAASIPAVRTHAAATQLRRLLKRLARQFRLVVIDLNYDDIADEAAIRWSDGFTRALDDALLFDPEQWLCDVADPTRHLLVHLHGSIRFGRQPSGAQWNSTPEEPAKYASYDIAKDRIAGFSSQVRADGKSYSAPYVISGISKGPKMVYNMRPYGYYLSALSQLAPVSQALLCIGYGWGDPHVNTLIDEFMTQRPSAPAVVVTRREGSHVGENMSSENYLARLSKSGWSALENWAYVDAPGRRTNWVGGRLRLFPYGFPLSTTGTNDVVKHLKATTY
jgi:hypothetical protein